MKEYRKNLEKRVEFLSELEKQVLSLFLPEEEGSELVAPMSIEETMEKLMTEHGISMIQSELFEILKKLSDNDLIQILTVPKVANTGRVTGMEKSYVFRDQYKLHQKMKELGLINETPRHPIEEEMKEIKV